MKMRVRLGSDRTNGGGVIHAGDVIDVSPAEAKRLLELGEAEVVRDESEPTTAIETAVAAPKENMARPTSKRAGGKSTSTKRG